MTLSIESRFPDLSIGSLHVADFGGAATGEVVCVHGLGGSHANWMSIADGLGDFGRVTAPDLPGFGLTAPEGRRCTVTANRKVLDTYLRTLDEPVILVGNSMGGTIAVLQAALAPETVRGLVLLAPALPAGRTLRSLGWLGQALDIVRRRPDMDSDPLTISRWTWELCTTRPDLVSQEVMEAHLEVAEARIGDDDFEPAIRRAAVSLAGMLSNHRLLDRQIAKIQMPTLIIHGDRDPLVNVENSIRATSINPAWRLEVLKGVGHLPMLETPETTKAIFADWAEGLVSPPGGGSTERSEGEGGGSL